MLENLSTAYLYPSCDAAPTPKYEYENDRRASKREVLNQLCFLVISIKGRRVTALVRDISKDGAKIETTCFELPQHFILDNRISKKRMVCKKVWSREGLTGVKFISPKAI